MNWQDRFIPGFLLLQAAMAAATLLWQGTVMGLSTWTWVIVVPFVLAAVVAGIAALRQLRWTRKLIVAIYAFQILSYVSPTFMFDLWLGLHFKLSVGWLDGGKIGVNLLALAMTGWAGSRWFPFAPAPAT